jgi:deoxyribonuclease V
MPRLRLHHEHPWNVSIETAREIQTRLAPLVCAHDDPAAPCRRVAGIDIGFEADGQVTKAAVTVLSFPDLRELESTVIRQPTVFPYVPGYLSFREVPAALAALAQLDVLPDLLLCDGQGYAHPRRFGLACHLGVLTGISAIGVAKTRLLGSYAELPLEKGAWYPLIDREECIGAVLCTRSGSQPLYISVGHKISLTTAIQRVLACTTRYRLPETTRRAHHLASVVDRRR